MMRIINWAGLRPNLTGAILAMIAVLIFFGQRIEETVWPVLHPPPAVSDTAIVGERLQWRLGFCKARPLYLEGSGFAYIYTQSPTRVAIPVNAVNETRGEPVGENPLPPGCFSIVYSVLMPKDARSGDEVQGEVWYRSFHNFWLVRQRFGTVVVPLDAGGK